MRVTRETRHLVKVTMFSTLPDTVKAFRTSQDKALQEHAPATACLQVCGLARPDFLVDIGAGAMFDDPA